MYAKTIDANYIWTAEAAETVDHTDDNRGMEASPTRIGSRK